MREYVTYTSVDNPPFTGSTQQKIYPLPFEDPIPGIRGDDADVPDTHRYYPQSISTPPVTGILVAAQKYVYECKRCGSKPVIETYEITREIYDADDGAEADLMFKTTKEGPGGSKIADEDISGY